MQSSLAVDIGDIPPNGTAVVRWFMTSSLVGDFKNFTATMQYETPLRDQRLSIVTSLRIQPLVHSTQGAGPNTLPDFLVDTDHDDDGLPDALFRSALGAQGPVNVVTPNVTVVSAPVYTTDGFYINVSIVRDHLPLLDGPTYIRVVDPITQAVPLARASGPNGFLPDDNLWRTYRVLRFTLRRRRDAETGEVVVQRERRGRVEIQAFVHLFDLQGPGNSSINYTLYYTGE